MSEKKWNKNEYETHYRLAKETAHLLLLWDYKKR